MSTLTDQFTEFTARTQDAARTWADTIRSVTSGPELPDAHVVIGRYFDLAQQALDGQRAFATAVVAAGSKAAETLTGKPADAANFRAT